MHDVYTRLRKRFFDVCENRNLLSESVRIKARVLSSEEAIGNPEADDFPLQKGKERLMQAEFGAGTGQAFTDRYGDFSGKLQAIIDMPLENNFKRAVFVSALNAVLRSVNEVQGTSHCRDKEPTLCAAELAGFLKERYGQLKITQVGFQPRMVEHLASAFDYRILDMDPDNIGTRKFDVVVEGPEATAEAVACFSLNALISSVWKLSQGFVQMHILIPLCIGTLIGSRFGATLNGRLPSPFVKALFGMIFVYVACKYLIAIERL